MERPPGAKEAIKDLAETKRELIEWREKSRIQERNFIKPNGPYGDLDVRRDLNECDAQEARWQQTYDTKPSHEQAAMVRGKENSGAIEALIVNQAELSEWLGPEAMVSTTSKYDDYFGGVDAYAEFPGVKDGEVAVLALDVTQHTYPEAVKKKVEANTKKVLGEGSSKIRYFESQILPEKDGLPFRGHALDVIPLVVGFDGTNSDQLGELFANRKQNAEALESTELKSIFLEEISTQLRFYLEIKHKKGKEGTGIQTAEIQMLLEIIEALQKEAPSTNVSDKTAEGIREAVKELSR